MSLSEPMPRDHFPKALQIFPDPVASELYRYRVVGRGPARIFCQEYEDKLRANYWTKRVAFCLPGIIHFFAAVAAQGIIGNFAWAAVCKLASRIRLPKREFFPVKLQFEIVISRTTYNGLRRKRHPDIRPSQAIAPKAESKLETQYRLMVLLKKTEAARLGRGTFRMNLLTTKKAAEMMGRSPATLRSWRCSKIGPPFVRLTTRSVMYDEKDIEKYIAERRSTPL